MLQFVFGRNQEKKEMEELFRKMENCFSDSEFNHKTKKFVISSSPFVGVNFFECKNKQDVLTTLIQECYYFSSHSDIVEKHIAKSLSNFLECGELTKKEMKQLAEFFTDSKNIAYVQKQEEFLQNKDFSILYKDIDFYALHYIDTAKKEYQQFLNNVYSFEENKDTLQQLLNNIQSIDSLEEWFASEDVALFEKIAKEQYNKDLKEISSINGNYSTMQIVSECCFKKYDALKNGDSLEEVSPELNESLNHKIKQYSYAAKNNLSYARLCKEYQNVQSTLNYLCEQNKLQKENHLE